MNFQKSSNPVTLNKTFKNSPSTNSWKIFGKKIGQFKLHLSVWAFTFSVYFEHVGPRLTKLRIDRMGFWSTFTKSISVQVDQRWHLLKNLVNFLFECRLTKVEMTEWGSGLLAKKKFPTRFPKVFLNNVTNYMFYHLIKMCI